MYGIPADLCPPPVFQLLYGEEEQGGGESVPSVPSVPSVEARYRTKTQVRSPIL